MNAWLHMARLIAVRVANLCVAWQYLGVSWLSLAAAAGTPSLTVLGGQQALLGTVTSQSPSVRPVNMSGSLDVKSGQQLLQPLVLGPAGLDTQRHLVWSWSRLSQQFEATATLNATWLIALNINSTAAGSKSPSGGLNVTVNGTLRLASGALPGPGLNGAYTCTGALTFSPDPWSALAAAGVGGRQGDVASSQAQPAHNQNRKLLQDNCEAAAARVCPSSVALCNCRASGNSRAAAPTPRQLQETKATNNNTSASLDVTVGGEVTFEDSAAAAGSPASIPTWLQDLTTGSGYQRLDASGDIVLRLTDLPLDLVIPTWKQQQQPQQPQQQQQQQPSASSMEPPLIIGVALGGCILLCAVWLVVGSTHQAGLAAPTISSWRGGRGTQEDVSSSNSGQEGGGRHPWAGGKVHY